MTTELSSLVRKGVRNTRNLCFSTSKACSIRALVLIWGRLYLFSLGVSGALRGTRGYLRRAYPASPRRTPSYFPCSNSSLRTLLSNMRLSWVLPGQWDATFVKHLLESQTAWTFTENQHFLFRQTSASTPPDEAMGIRICVQSMHPITEGNLPIF